MKRKKYYIFAFVLMIFLATGFTSYRYFYGDIFYDYHGIEGGDYGWYEDWDYDGLTYQTEIEMYKTDPNNSDTDGDGYSDGEEVTNGYDPLVAATVTTTVHDETSTKTEVPESRGQDVSLDAEVNIKADVTKTENCGSQDCFEKKFAVCEPATLLADMGVVSFSYQIIGPVNGGCSMTVKFPTNPNPAWVNQPMTCTFDNTIDFETSVQNVIGAKNTDCVGPLVKLMNE